MHTPSPMVSSRLGRAGAVSAPRALSLLRRLIQPVRASAWQQPVLCCIDGLCSYGRAIRETFRLCDDHRTLPEKCRRAIW